jgi:hypothetical protein
LYGYVPDTNVWIDVFGLSDFDPYIFGEITPFPKDIYFGQDRISPNFRTMGAKIPEIAGRPVLEVASEINLGIINPNKFEIAYTIDPATGRAVTLNNRGLAALAEGGRFPENAILVPYEKVPSRFVKDILERPPSKTIPITKNKDGSGFIKAVTMGCPK